MALRAAIAQCDGVRLYILNNRILFYCALLQIIAQNPLALAAIAIRCKGVLIIGIGVAKKGRAL
jgi:hypothetical protein